MTSPPPITVYYDGACPVCAREITTYRRLLPGDAVCWVDAATCADDAFGPGLDRDRALGRFTVRDGGGDLTSGVDAFIALWARVPVLAPFARFAALPWARFVLDLGYRGFLRARRIWRRPVRP